ncbi:MAG: hypothetical protein EBX36_08365 [Planctomycetia bacterium]|nr:hypothetical protein [Planctomycetia bacterium]
MGSISCICGYRGPAVTEAGRDACPICRTPAADRDELLHFPCPRGHVLEVGVSMVGQRVVCPKCNEFFVLAAEESLERRRERERLREETDARRARLWLLGAVWAAVLVLAALATLIVVSVLRR